MPKHYLTDSRDSRPYRPKAARTDKLSSPSSASSSSSGSGMVSDLDSKQTAADKRAAEAIARYNEVNLLFSSQFPGIDISGGRHQSPVTSPTDSADRKHHTFFSSEDSDDPDRELAYELNEAMGLVRHTSSWSPPGTFAAMPSYSTTADISLEAETTMPNLNTNDQYTDLQLVDENSSSKNSPPMHGYPFTSPAGGELMVTASPVDASYRRMPPAGSKVGSAVEDIGWLGDHLQRNARLQLQELSNGNQDTSYAS